MARVLKWSRSYTCTPRVHSLITEWNIPAFSFPAEAGTHLPTPEGWKAELALWKVKRQSIAGRCECWQVWRRVRGFVNQWLISSCVISHHTSSTRCCNYTSSQTQTRTRLVTLTYDQRCVVHVSILSRVYQLWLGVVFLLNVAQKVIFIGKRLTLNVALNGAIRYCEGFMDIGTSTVAVLNATRDSAYSVIHGPRLMQLHSGAKNGTILFLQ